MGPPVLMELSILVPVGLADLAPSGPSIHVPMEQAIHVPLTLCANEGIQLCAKGITHPCISRASCLSANGCLPCVKWDFQSLCQWSVPLSASVIDLGGGNVPPALSRGVSTLTGDRRPSVQAACGQCLALPGRAGPPAHAEALLGPGELVQCSTDSQSREELDRADLPSPTDLSFYHLWPTKFHLRSNHYGFPIFIHLNYTQLPS